MDNDIRPGARHNTTPATGYSPFNNPLANHNTASPQSTAGMTPPAVGTPLPNTAEQPTVDTPTASPASPASTPTSPFAGLGSTATPGAAPAAHQFGSTTANPVSPANSAQANSLGTPTAPNAFTGGSTPTTPASAPTPSMAFGSTAPNGVTPPMTAKKKSPLKWILIIGIPVIILIGVLVWYLAVFNNKYNIVRSALYSMMGQRDNSLAYDLAVSADGTNLGLAGTMKYLADSTASGDISINMTSNDASIDVGQISFASNSDNLYLKLSPSEALTQFGIDLSSTGLTDQWIEISADDLESSSMTSSSSSADVDSVMQCYQSAGDLMNDRANQQQIVDALLDTDFLVIGNSGKDDHGTFYEISLNGANFAAFYHRLIDSNAVQSVTSCLADKGFDVDTDLSDDELADTGDEIDKINPTIKFWIQGAFTRQLTRVQVDMNVASTSDDASISLTIDLDNQTPTIEMPTDTMTLQEIVEQNPAGFMQLFMNISGATTGTGSLTSGGNGAYYDPSQPWLDSGTSITTSGLESIQTRVY